MGRDVLLVMQTCLMALFRRSPYIESLEMTTPRRGPIGPVGEDVVLVGLDGLLNLTFLIPMRLPMFIHETNFFVSSGGNGWGVVWREGGVKGFHRVVDEVGEVAERKGFFRSIFPKEEAGADPV